MDPRPASLSLFLLPVLLAAVLASGYEAGSWYRLLAQPWFGLPAWSYVIAWPCYGLFMALAAWRLWLGTGTPEWRSLLAWLACLITMVAWFWLLFGLHRPGWALGLSTLQVAILLETWRRFRAGAVVAARLLLPCLAWLVYLWMWNLAVWRLAGGGFTTLFD